MMEGTILFGKRSKLIILLHPGDLIFDFGSEVGRFKDYQAIKGADEDLQKFEVHFAR